MTTRYGGARLHQTCQWCHERRCKKQVGQTEVQLPQERQPLGHVEPPRVFHVSREQVRDFVKREASTHRARAVSRSSARASRSSSLAGRVETDERTSAPRGEPIRAMNR